MKRQSVLLCAIRKQKYECAEIIQYKLHKEGIAVSLSSVKRTIRAARIMAEKEKIPPERKETDANRPRANWFRSIPCIMSIRLIAPRYTSTP
nr:MAG TPA: arginine repressor [Caudoviricetes sp.]